MLNNASKQRLFTKREVYTAINQAKPESSPGMDNISGKVWQQLIEDPTILEFLVLIFNRMLVENHIPQCFKEAVIIPIPKPNGGYRPISLRVTLSKTLERMICTRIYETWLPRDTQFGCRKGHSSIDAVIRLLHQSSMAFSKDEYFAAIFLDFSKAYDRLSRKKLVLELYDLNIPPALVLLIDNWLQSRTFKVKHKGVLSGLKFTSNGLPQGSCLSVALWLIYIDRIAISKNDQLFMDDTCITASGKSLRQLNSKLQTKLNNILSWCQSYSVRINPEKTKLLLNSYCGSFHVTLDDTKIFAANYAKYLGVDLRSFTDGDLIRVDVSGICSDVIRRCNLLKMLRSRLSKHQLKIFACGSILGKIQYYLPLLGAEHPSVLEPLEKAWRKALRIITGNLPSTPIAILYSESQLPTIKELVEESCGRLFRRLMSYPNILSHDYLVWNGEGDGYSPLGAVWRSERSIPRSFLRKDMDYNGIERRINPSFENLESLFKVEISCESTRESALNLYQKNLLLKNGDVKLWNDGGYLQNVASIGCCIGDTTTGVMAHFASSFYPSCSSFHAECIAMYKGLVWIQQHFVLDEKTLIIHTDSRSLVQHLGSLVRRPKPVSSTVKNLLNELEKIISSNTEKICIQWIPGHEGIGLNNEADSLASKGLKINPSSCFLPGSFLNQHFRRRRHINMKKFLKEHLKDSADPSNPERQPFYVKKFLNTPEHELHLSRPEEIAIARIRSGHCMLNHVLNRFDPKVSPFCPRCLEHDEQVHETIEHVLMSCSYLNTCCKAIRQKILERPSFQGGSIKNFLVSSNPGDFDLLLNLVETLLKNNIHF